jgi:GntR family transcriptional regulator
VTLAGDRVEAAGAHGAHAAELEEGGGSGIALWARLAESLRRRLREGEFDERFPTEAELVADYDVSRATVREALRRLRAEGLLEARQGAGTFVLQRQLDEPILGRVGLARMIEGAGLSERSRILRAEAVVAGPLAATVLGCDSQSEALRLERLRMAGGQPIALDRSVILVSGAARRRILSAPLDHGSIYDILESRAGLRVDAGRELVRAVECPPAERRLLALGRREGALELERIAYAGAVAVEWRTTLLKGSHYVFGTVWGAPPPAPAPFGSFRWDAEHPPR